MSYTQANIVVFLSIYTALIVSFIGLALLLL